jgi:hypothetical protein
MTKRYLLTFLDFCIFALFFGGLWYVQVETIDWFYDLDYGLYLIVFLQFMAIFFVSCSLAKYIEWREK